MPQPNYGTDSWEFPKRRRKQGYVSTLAGRTGQRGFRDGDGATAQFDTPQGVCVDRARNVYVADTGNHRIRMIAGRGTTDPDGAGADVTVSTYAGSGVAGSADGVLAEAQFSSPSGVTVWYDWPSQDPDLYPSQVEERESWVGGVSPLLVIYVADTGNHRIRKIQGP